MGDRLTSPFVCYGGRSRGSHFIWRDGRAKLNPISRDLLSTTGTFTKPSFLSSLSYLPFFQIVSISAYFKFPKQRSRVPVRDFQPLHRLAASRISSIFYTNRETARLPLAGFISIFPRAHSSNLREEMMKCLKYYIQYLIPRFIFYILSGKDRQQN